MALTGADLSLNLSIIYSWISVDPVTLDSINASMLDWVQAAVRGPSLIGAG
jgi:hypothetical protein